MHKADNLPPSCVVVTKFGNLNFLKPSGPVQDCNWTDLPLLLVPRTTIRRLTDGGLWAISPLHFAFEGYVKGTV